MRRGPRIAISFAFGALAVIAALAYAEGAREEVRLERSEALERYGGEVTTLVVARSNLAAGDIVSESSVEEREWLSDLAPSGSITNISDVVGVRLSSAVAKGEPLNEVDIAGVDGAIEVPEGRVALTVSLGDKTGIDRSVASGSCVLAYRYVDENLELISSDALVLTNTSTTSSSSKDKISLAVLPNEIEAVLAAASDGSLRLALPGAGVDSSSFTTNSAPSSVDVAEKEESAKEESAKEETEKEGVESGE